MMKKKLLMIALVSAALGSGSYLLSTRNFGEWEKYTEKEEFFMEEEHEKPKANAPDEYFLYHKLIRTGADETEPGYSMNYQLKELQGAMGRLPQSMRMEADSIKWTERGPANVAGRTRGLLIDPTDASSNTWFAGSASGGIWKTTNGGKSWTNLTPKLPNLSTSTLAMCLSNPNVIYAGTGEGFNNTGGVIGNGIFKSTDRGNSWTQLASTASDARFEEVNRIIVDPKNENVLVAVTNTGIYRSVDGGSSWTTSYERPGLTVQHIVHDPLNFNIQYAAVNGQGVLKSTNGGAVWGASSNGLSQGERIELAISHTDASKPARLYASVEAGTTTSLIYMSPDNGDSWQLLEEAGGSSTNYLGGQGWYNNTIAVHPYNENIVFVGGVNLWKVEAKEETRKGALTVTGVREINTSSFLDFINVTNFTLWNGRLQAGTAQMASVEIRFGNGKKQKAHRFTVPDGATSGVPAASYTYRDYIDVPFEVWDVTTNRQLMVSFRDQSNNKVFDLIERNDAANILGREYVYIHDVNYNATTPDAGIARNGGHEAKMMYNLWPTLTAGATWNSAALPESMLRIAYEEPLLRKCATSNVSDRYNNYGGKNEELHPDHHNLAIVPVDKASNKFRIINANDGGIAISEDGGDTFIHRNAGYNVTQFYSVDKRKGSNEYMGGAQDNGCWRSPAASVDKAADYLSLSGGDGFDVVWHAKDPNKYLTSAQHNYLFLFKDGTTNAVDGTAGLKDAKIDSLSSFITRLANSKEDPDVVYAVSKKGVWRSSNFASSWSLVSIPNKWLYKASNDATPTHRPLQVAISDATPQVVWAGAGMSGNTTMHVSTDRGQSFKAVNIYAERAMGAITGLATHPLQSSTAYALFSIAGRPKVLRTTDMGQTWEDLSGFGKAGTKSTNGFPDVATYCLLVFPHDPARIWVGTEIGIFESRNSGKNWYYLDSGLPAVSVWKMKLVDNQVVVATHGRGIWTADLPPSYATGLLSGTPAAKSFKLYPNPAVGKVYLEIPASNVKECQVAVYNSIGQIVFNQTLQNTGKMELNLDHLIKGAYVISVNSGKERYTQKLLID